MDSKQRLSALEPGGRAVIESIGLDGPLYRRLLELGLIPGTHVRCLLRAPSGSPIAYEIRSAAIALRRADAEHICIRQETPWD